MLINAWHNFATGPWFRTSWVIYMALWSIFGAWLSKMNNSSKSSIYLIIMWVSVVFPGWQVISRYSDKLGYDALIYDTLVLLLYTGGMFFFGAGAGFTKAQWLGVGITFLGLGVIRLCGK